MNINKLTLNGVEYNLTDKDAQSKIVSLQENTYTKAEVDNLVDSVDVSDQLTEYAKKSELPAEYDDTDVKARITALENIDHTQYLTKNDAEDTYVTYGDGLDQALYDAATDNTTAFGSVVSDVNDLKEKSKGYLTEHQDISGLASKTYVDGKVADLVNSAPETLDTLGELATAITEHKEVTDALDAAITQKVDKVDGKGLSTNDYTTAEKNKLAATPSFWVGSQAEYDAIAVKDTHTFYYITE